MQLKVFGSQHLMPRQAFFLPEEVHFTTYVKTTVKSSIKNFNFWWGLPRLMSELTLPTVVSDILWQKTEILHKCIHMTRHELKNHVKARPESGRNGDNQPPWGGAVKELFFPNLCQQNMPGKGWPTKGFVMNYIEMIVTYLDHNFSSLRIGIVKTLPWNQG